MSRLLQLPELLAVENPPALIRIPDQVDVPVTKRVLRLVDSSPFRRLSRVSQLGLVSLVYPGATHNRFEHSLGAYRLGLMFLRRLATQERFQQLVDEKTATCFLVTMLLHDIGHWPYCHPVEDLRLDQIPDHESSAQGWLENPSIADALDEDWGLKPADLLRLLENRPASLAERVACSLLSGPIDPDKMDYLARDSLHCGVPYGRNFDPMRLVNSLCLDSSGEKLAITSKGKTAAEMMVFARYVMFSEVYWHHAVRSATAMLQRAVFLAANRLDVSELTRSTEADFGSIIRKSLPGESHFLIDGLFGERRSLFKRLWESGESSDRELHHQIAHRSYRDLLALSESLSTLVAARYKVDIPPNSLLIDAPPQGLEVQFRIEVVDSRTGKCLSLGEISPVVESLANRQFDDFVKKVRVFASAGVAGEIRQKTGANSFESLLREAIAHTFSN